MPVETVSEFWFKLESSGVIDPTLLTELQNRHNSIEDPRVCASQLVKDGVLTKWQAKFLLSGRSQLRIGSYILQDRLHRDELGDRFLAIHQQLDRKVELQLLPTKLAQQSNGVARFLDKAQRAAKLDHPNIIHVYDIDQASGQYYLVTENIHGVPLGQQKNGALRSVHLIVENINGLSEAVGYAHQNGVIHGSIGPDNIVLGHDGILRLRNIALATAARMLKSDQNSVELQPDEAGDAEGVFEVANYLVNENRSAINRQPAANDLMQLNNAVGAMLARCQSMAEPGTRLSQLASECQQWLQQYPKPMPQIPVVNDNPIDESLPTSPDESKRSKSALIPIIAVTLIIIVLIGGAWGIVYLYGEKDDAAKSINKNSSPNENGQTRFTKSQEGQAGNLPDSPLITKGDANDKKQQIKPEQDPATQVNADNQNKQTPVKNTQQNNKTADANNSTSISEKQDVAASNQASQSSGQDEPLPEPFSQISDRVELPPVEGPETHLGKVFTGKNFLLALDLIADRTISRTKVDFTLERDKSDKQKWNVYCSPKKDVNELVAFFNKSGDDLIFRWTDNAQHIEQANYLRNCQIKLETRGKSKSVSLRKPVSIPPVLLTADEAESKIDVPLDWLPQPDSIIIELKAPPGEGFPEHVVHDENFVIGGRDKPVVIFLHRDENKRISWIKFESSVSSKIKIATELQFLAGRMGKKYTPKLFDKFVTAIQARALQTKAQLEALNAYNPAYGEKTKVDEAKKEVSKALELANAQFENAVLFRNEIIPGVFNHAFEFEIYYQRGGDKILLAQSEK